MKIKQLFIWIQDNNVDETIDKYIKNRPTTLKTIELIEKYILDEFVKMDLQSEEIGKRMVGYRNCITRENVKPMLEDKKTLEKIGAKMGDLDMIATYIETHKPK